MSIESEIIRLQDAKTDLAAAISEQGVPVSQEDTLDVYGAMVRKIPGNALLLTISITGQTGNTFAGSSDTADTQILEAAQKGHLVYAMVPALQDAILPLASCVAGVVQFGGVVFYNGPAMMKAELAGTSVELTVHPMAPAVVSADAGKYIRVGANGSLTAQEMEKTKVDDILSFDSLNPVQNRVVKAALDKKLNKSDALQTASHIKGIAHRGYSVEAPENTLPAFRLAKEKGFEYVECDVYFTSDGVPVLLHDVTIDRTSNGTGNIFQMTYEEVLEYDFGSWKSEAYAGTKIARFDDFMVLCKALGLKPYVDLRVTQDVELLVGITRSCGMLGETTFLSYDRVGVFLAPSSLLV